MRKLICSILFSIAVFTVAAQDPNFSQFFASPLTLNPALTGKFDGQLRGAVNYRNQWPTINNAFTTYTVSADFNILKSSVPEIDQFGVGLLGFRDQSGNGVLKTEFYGISTAYHKGLDENGNNQIGAGFQVTNVTKRLDVAGLKFEDMLTSNGFTGITQETFSNTRLSVSYVDVNAGLLFNGSSNGENNYYAGVSLYHINRPKESFMRGQFYLPSRMTIQAGGMVPVNQYDAIHLSANHSRQAAATNTVIGGAYMMNLNPDQPSPTNLYLGTWYRFGDAFIPYVGLEFGEFHIGLTYDVNTSGLKPASNMRGGAEISLIYIKQPSDPNARKFRCPKF